MVWLTFSFLLGIPKTLSNVDEKPKKISEKSQVMTKNYREIEVVKPIFSCHIEYVLFPMDPPKQIDVICWDEVAKIYYENTSTALRPLVVDQLLWIHFRVNHKLKLKKHNVPKFFEHNVRIVVTLSNRKFGDRAKSDNVKKFYCPKFEDDECDNPIKKQLFQPVSEKLEELYSSSYFKEYLTPRQQLYISLDSTMETSENFNRLYAAMTYLTKEYNENGGMGIPSPAPQELPPIKNLLKPELETNISGEKKEKDKAETDNVKDIDGGTIELLVPGESFFSGRKTIENCAKYHAPQLPYLFNLIKVRNVMTQAQAEFFNPLTVFLSHCTSIPAKSLWESGVTALMFQYVICDEYLVKSNLIPMGDSMKLNFSRTILTDKTDKTKLIQFLQTGGLKIEVFGDLALKNSNATNALGHLYGDYDENHQIMAAHRKGNGIFDIETNSDGFVLLGTVFADISSILLQPHKILLKCNFQTPLKGESLQAFENSANITNIYELYMLSSNKQNLTLCDLKVTDSPVLTLSVKMGYPIAKVYQTVLTNPDLLNRLFAVVYDKNLIISIKQIIVSEMRGFLEMSNHCKSDINVKKPLTKNHEKQFVNFSAAYSKPQMTGFLIDSVNKILVFVEGPINSNIQKIWALLSYMKPFQGHVLYDSSLIFTERLYSNHLNQGGIVQLNFPKDVESVFLKPKKCSKMPFPYCTWKTLSSLKMLINCKSIKTAIQNHFLPSYQCLNSLAIEFSLPIQMCNL